MIPEVLEKQKNKDYTILVFLCSGFDFEFSISWSDILAR